MREPDPDLAAMAHDELERACSLSWRELSKVTPWGDTFEGISPAGREVQVERNYLWAGEPGGEVLCEVRVYVNTALYDAGEQAARTVSKP